MTPEIKKLIDGIVDIFYDLDDHRSESFPYFASRMLKVFGHDVSEESIEAYLKED